MYPHIFESTTFSFRIRLPSTRIRLTSPLSRVEIFEYAMIRKRVDAKSEYFIDH